MIVPPFPPLDALQTWPDLTLLAATVFLEAEGEPEAGATAVAWVVHNRMTRWHQDLHTVVLAPYQFSCWNPGDAAHAQARLAASHDPAWAWRAAAIGLWGLGSDLSLEATHYLNKDLVLKMAGKLPSWYDRQRVTITLGRHTFLNLG